MASVRTSGNLGGPTGTGESADELPNCGESILPGWREISEDSEIVKNGGLNCEDLIWRSPVVDFAKQAHKTRDHRRVRFTEEMTAAICQGGNDPYLGYAPSHPVRSCFFGGGKLRPRGDSRN